MPCVWITVPRGGRIVWIKTKKSGKKIITFFWVNVNMTKTCKNQSDSLKTNTKSRHPSCDGCCLRRQSMERDQNKPWTSSHPALGIYTFQMQLGPCWNWHASSCGRKSSLLTGRNLEQDQAPVGAPADGCLGNRDRVGARTEGGEEQSHTGRTQIHSSCFCYWFFGISSRCQHTVSKVRVFVDVDELSAEIRVWEGCEKLWWMWNFAKILLHFHFKHHYTGTCSKIALLQGVVWLHFSTTGKRFFIGCEAWRCTQQHHSQLNHLTWPQPLFQRQVTCAFSAMTNLSVCRLFLSAALLSTNLPLVHNKTTIGQSCVSVAVLCSETRKGSWTMINVENTRLQTQQISIIMKYAAFHVIFGTCGCRTVVGVQIKENENKQEFSPPPPNPPWLLICLL